MANSIAKLLPNREENRGLCLDRRLDANRFAHPVLWEVMNAKNDFNQGGFSFSVDYGFPDAAWRLKWSTFSTAACAPSFNPRTIAASAGSDLAIIIDGKTTPYVTV
jgi:hypothetical protein